jgi:Protein of unknown function, DUF481
VIRGRDAIGETRRSGAPRTIARALRLALALVPFATLGVGRAWADKTDLVVLVNGDHITGEVKGLARGKLDYSTDDAGRLSIEWDKIAKITSPHPFHLETSDGIRYFGLLAASDRSQAVVVRGERSDTLDVDHVVEITPLNANFVERVTSYLDVGFTLAKANQATTFSLGGAADYRGATFGSQLSFDSYAQGQETVPTTTRNTIRQSVSWYLPERWSAVGLVQIEQNDELDLDHRLTAGGAMSRALQHTNQMELSLGAGLVGTQEQYRSVSGTTRNTSLEGLVALDWDAFRFDSPKLDFNTAVAVFPSLSQAGRVRGQGALRLQYEVFKDFNAGIRLTDTFDSRPPEGATKNDYIVTLTIGWSYRR